MPVRIRLQRHGKKGKPIYWIVAADSRAKRDGRYLEKLGLYNPNTLPASVELNLDRAVDWLQKGAQPSHTARNLLSEQGAMLKNHLINGLNKGALTEDDVNAKFEAWVNEKEGKNEVLKKKIDADAEKARAAAIAAEKEVSIKRKEAAAAAQAQKHKKKKLLKTRMPKLMMLQRKRHKKLKLLNQLLKKRLLRKQPLQQRNKKKKHQLRKLKLLNQLLKKRLLRKQPLQQRNKKKKHQVKKLKLLNQLLRKHLLRKHLLRKQPL